jgi:hypothetical protein
VPGFKRPPDGYVSLSLVADLFGVDRRVLKQLSATGELVGVRASGVICLELQSLSAYLCSRPQCVEDGCDLLVIGDGPGCHLHRRRGRHHSEETKRKMSTTQRTIRGTLLRVVQWHLCERQGCDRWTGHDHFCSHDCSRDVSLNRDPERLQEGNREFWARVKRVKDERHLVDVKELVDTPPGVKPFRAGRLRRAGVPRTAAALSDHIRDGWLKTERDLGFDKPYLFTEQAVDEYIRLLRAEDPVVRLDGRLTRWNATTEEQARSRGALYLAITGSTAESGRLATAVGKGAKRSRSARDLEQRIVEALGSGMTRTATAQQIGCTERFVREVASRYGLGQGTPGRPRKTGTTP